MHTTFDIGGDLTVNRLGFGAMRLTGQPGNFGPFPDWEAGLALVRRAADLGVNFFDSAHAYGPGHADRLLGEALEGRDVVIATKGGVSKPEPGHIVVDGSRDTLLRQVDQALINLRRDQIDLFQLHRVDPNVPIERSVRALDEARRDGRIRMIGLSNIDHGHLERAMMTAPIASVQNRFNSAELGDASMVDFTRRHGIAYIPYGPLGAHPMRRGAALQPPHALKWLLEHARNIIVIPGTTSVTHLEANIAAGDAFMATG